MTSAERAADRARRARHGLVASTFATFVALLSHVLAGGGWPGWLGLLAPWVLATAASVLLAGRRPSLVRIGLSVAISQAFFHALFVLGSPAVSGRPSGHHHAAAATLPVAGGQAVDASMWFAHALAAAVTIAVLYRAERIWALLQRLARSLGDWFRRRASVLSPAHVAAAPRLPVDRAWPIPAGLFPATLRRRGPPSLLAA